jgi:ubiquinone/menaquinone biosynthesis C-methylase UbiE
MTQHLTPPVAQQIQLETEFWDTDPFERPGSDSLENVLNKAVEAAIFSDIVMQFRPQFSAAAHVVEVGGGQGWASCIVKRMYPAAHVTLTDAVPSAVHGRGIWQRVFNCTLDAALAAPAQSVPLPDASADLIFCYAAAHHFVDHEAALAEAYRLLSPGGWCLWLCEPTSSTLLHAAAERRVNKKRPDVHEHVLVPSRVLQQARAAGFEASVRYWPNTLRRGRFETLYYLGLSFMPWLCRVLPCTAHFAFRRAP